MVGTNGIANANYFVLASSNLSLPFSNWTRMSTNVFSGNGGFGFSNALDVNSPRQFYLLQLP